MKPFRWVINVQTNERQKVELTDEEIAKDEANALAQAQRRAAEKAKKDDEDLTKAVLTAVAEKIKADPTILDRL